MRKTRKREIMKKKDRLTAGQLRRIIREEIESMSNYQEAEWKMDRWMPTDEESQQEYYDILQDISRAHNDPSVMEEIKEDLVSLFYGDADLERFGQFAGSNATIEGFVDYLIAKA